MESLNPRVRLAWAGAVVVLAALVALPLAAAVAFFDRGPPWLAAVLAAAVVIVGLVHVILRYRAWGFAVREDTLYLQRGVLTKVVTSVPFVRVQHVDTQRGPVERLLGLASVVVYTAGSRGADVSIPGLRPDRAERLREQLRELAIESEAEDAV